MATKRRRITAEEQQLIRELYPSLRGYARVVAPAEMEPEDLVQEAFLQMLRRNQRTQIDNPGAYLRRTMVNLASNQRRRLGRQRKALPLLASPGAANDSYPSDVAALLGLRPQARAVMYLRVIEGHSYRDIAAMLGCRESSARTTATRARRVLKKLISEEVPGATA